MFRSTSAVTLSPQPEVDRQFPGEIGKGRFFRVFFSIREAHNQLKLTMDQHLSLAGYPSHLKAQPSSLRNAKGFADQNVVSHYRSSISESRPQHDQIRSIISARYMMVYSLVV